MADVCGRSLQISETLRAEEEHYREVPHVSGMEFSWRKYLDEVKRDIETARDAKRKQGPSS